MLRTSATATALVGLLPLLVATPAQAGVAGGHTDAADGKLRHGCHGYAFTYAVTTPYDDWTLETEVVDPRGRSVASHAFIGPSDPSQGTGRYTLCRWATRAGQFTIRGKLTWYDGPEGVEVSLPASTFRLRRP
jgi:hypothetical protein